MNSSKKHVREQESENLFANIILAMAGVCLNPGKRQFAKAAKQTDAVKACY